MQNDARHIKIRNKIRLSPGEWVFEIINHAFLGFFAFACLYPFVSTLAVSLSSNRAIMAGEVFLWPIEFSPAAYVEIWQDGILGKSMLNTVYMTVGGTLVNMVATILFAYPMSRAYFPGKRIILILMVITMFVGGGLIPTYMLMRNIGLMNKFEGLWILSFYGISYMIMLRTFFQHLPYELQESAKIDGASDPLVLVRIVLPLSKPILATLTLFYAVGWWNAYMMPLLYLHGSEKITLMLRLRYLLWMSTQNIQQIYEEGIAQRQRMTPEAFKGASIMVSTLPIIMVYPFLQKHFAKGVMIGSIKG
ncbi:MAG: carbohydrate ABC transporter permease [Defluviitaleaceae bacterium]|nr:carbohydrate ABC transporter permease [Defluviitaleaceae bacterium]